MDGSMHSWLIITTLIRAPHCWPRTECSYQKYIVFDYKESIVFIIFKNILSLYATVNVYTTSAHSISVHAPALHLDISQVHMHQSFYGLWCNTFSMAVQICQQLPNLPRSFVQLCFNNKLACGTEIQNVGLIIYASTLWVWIRGEACTEVVKPFKCFLHTSACLSQCPWEIIY